MNFVRAGLQIIRRNPVLAAAEIAWRWSFGFSAWLLVGLAVRQILAGIALTDAEAAIAQANNQFAIADAIVRVIVQVLPRMPAAAVVLAPAITILWIAAATIGRSLTLRTLTRGHESANRTGWFRLLLLNSLRAVVTLASAIAFFGVVILVSAGHANPQTVPLLVLLALCLGLVVGFLWGIVNWFLALAAIFVVRDGRGVFAAIGDSLGLYRDQRNDYSAITFWFGFFRTGALVLALVAAAVAGAAASVTAAVAVSVAIALLYFAVADYLYIARLAAFVDLLESPPASAETLPQPLVPDAEPPALTPTETETRN